MSTAKLPWRVNGNSIWSDDGYVAELSCPRGPDARDADAALIVASVNNHAPMLKSLEHCAKLFDVLALKLDRWATESRSGGWSTHQVDENRKAADDCRRYAGHIRAAIPRSPQENAHD